VIQGYAEQPSPRVGSVLRLRVATDAARWRADFYRVGQELVHVAGTDWLPGCRLPPHLPYQDWGENGQGLAGEPLPAWPLSEIPLPPDWPPGVYVVVFQEADGDCGEPRTSRSVGAGGRPEPVGVDARSGRALFVLRPSLAPTRYDDRPRILYKLPLFTYHAYNLVDPAVYDPATASGSWCLYNMPRPEEVPVPFPEAVSVHRPGGGTGGAPYDTFNFDPFDPTPRQTYVHWDGRMIAWLEREGFRLDFCTDFDLHEEGRSLLDPYRLLLSAGHDEYWSQEMRDATEAYTRGGGNVAFFGGNTAWWRIVFHSRVSFSREGFWWEAGRPENAMTGVSFRNGGERDRDDHPTPVGFQVQHADHWAYAGTGVCDGDVFGDGPGEYIVGYECDGAAFDRDELGSGRPVRPTGEDGTPDCFQILAIGDTVPSGWGNGNCAATMGEFTAGGTVFTAGTTDWPRALASGNAPAVEQITRNVVDRLGG
jgi:hypothetical protein